VCTKIFKNAFKVPCLEPASPIFVSVGFGGGDGKAPKDMQVRTGEDYVVGGLREMSKLLG